jgi:glycogen synthase
MRVLFTTDTLGGVWTYAIELARAMRPMGVEFILATMGGPLSDAQRRQVSQLDYVLLKESAYRLEWQHKPWDDVRRAGDWLLTLAHELRPDLVHLNSYAHGQWPFDMPTLVVGHSCVPSWWEAVKGEAAPAQEWARYRSEVWAGLHRANLVVAPSAAMLECLQKHYGPLSATRVIYNGRDPSRFQVPPVGSPAECMGSPTRQRGTGVCIARFTVAHASGSDNPADEGTGGTFAPAADAKQNFVLAAGRLWDEAKNIAVLESVAEHLPWPVYVAGEERHPDQGGASAPAASPEQQHPGRQQHKLTLFGKLDEDAMAGCFARASIYCLPARYEPFGLSALEAAISGCALVLGDIPSLREVWGDEAAVYVPPNDSHALREALLGLIRHPAERKERARLAQARAKRYTAAAMAEAYLDAYQQLLASPSGDVGPSAPREKRAEIATASERFGARANAARATSPRGPSKAFSAKGAAFDDSPHPCPLPGAEGGAGARDAEWSRDTNDVPHGQPVAGRSAAS